MMILLLGSSLGPFVFGAMPVVSAAPATAPVNTELPVVSGIASFGNNVVCSDGVWTGSPTFTYQWFATDLVEEAEIAGQTANIYECGLDDIGNYLLCKVTGTNAAGSATAVSNIVGPVTAF